MASPPPGSQDIERSFTEHLTESQPRLFAGLGPR
jgi:hypothetical protein